MEAALLTREQKRAQQAIRVATVNELLGLYSFVDPTALSSTMAPFAVAAARVVAAKSDESTLSATRYYEEFRSLEGARNTLLGVAAAQALPVAIAETVIRGAALAGIIRARRRGATARAALKNGFVRTAGAASSLVLGGGRKAIETAVRGDPEALGWQRVTSAHPCAFCRMLASRGPAYKSRATSSFQAHHHCSCIAEPYFEGSAPLRLNQIFRKQWDAATGDGVVGPENLKKFREFVESGEHAHEAAAGEEEEELEEEASPALVGLSVSTKPEQKKGERARQPVLTITREGKGTRDGSEGRRRNDRQPRRRRSRPRQRRRVGR